VSKRTTEAGEGAKAGVEGVGVGVGGVGVGVGVGVLAWVLLQSEASLGV
jgi:hypothetical protein